MAEKRLDEIDRRILARLQDNARVPNVDLARQVGPVAVSVLASAFGNWKKPG